MVDAVSNPKKKQRGQRDTTPLQQPLIALLSGGRGFAVDALLLELLPATISARNGDLVLLIRAWVVGFLLNRFRFRVCLAGCRLIRRVGFLAAGCHSRSVLQENRPGTYCAGPDWCQVGRSYHPNLGVP